nr:uncharacterized protein LOC127326371 [Lolium perenne]
METIKDFDLSIRYTPGKANVMADALSRKSYCNNLMIQESQPALYEEFRKLNLELVPQGYLANLVITQTLEDKIRKGQLRDICSKNIKENMHKPKYKSFSIDDQGTLFFQEHQRPAGVLQPLKIPEWKWDKFEMDFVAHFLPVKETISASQLAELYTAKIVSLHGVPLEISSDRGSIFTSRTPLNWSETGERQIFGPDVINEAEEKVRIIRDNLKIAQSRQKSYYDSKHRDMIYQPGDQAYLRVTPMRGTHRFGIKGKLAPRYIGPFKVLAKRGEVAYLLELPEKLSKVHDVFHASQLKKCFKDPDRAVDHESIDLQEDLSYKEHPVRILDEAERRTRNNSVKFLKVQWSHHSDKEATWEREDQLHSEYPSFFSSS